MSLITYMQICELDPGHYRDSETLMSNLKGRYEVLAVSVHAEGNTHIDQYDDFEDVTTTEIAKTYHMDANDTVVKLSEKMQKQSISAASGSGAEEGKQNKCITCIAYFGDSKEFRDHCKSDWHKHNVKRKSKQLPPLTEEECMLDLEVGDSKGDLKDYSF